MPAHRLLSALILALLLTGCSAPEGPTGLTFPAENYAKAFDAARDSLRDHRFELDRVDARLGVLTTRVKPSDGLASPWDEEQATFRQEWEDLTNHQGRRVRIAFTPVSGSSQDLLTYTGPIVAKVSVSLVRTQRPGWRPSISSIRGSTQTIDPVLEAQGRGSSYESLVADDDILARTLADSIRTRLAVAETPETGFVRVPTTAEFEAKAAKPPPKGTTNPSPADNR